MYFTQMEEFCGLTSASDKLKCFHWHVTLEMMLNKVTVIAEIRCRLIQRNIPEEPHVANRRRV